MKALVLGCAGMLGHQLWRALAPRMETWGTVRGVAAEADDVARAIGGVNAEDFATVAEAVERVAPDVVINAIGVVKRHPSAADPVANIAVNALFPQRLARLVAGRGIRLVHIGTDCVFSGEGRDHAREGGYREEDPPDPRDLYGRTKLLGEVSGPGLLTLRASLIGRELRARRGLLEWFLAHRGGRVPGYTRAFFSGMTTGALAEVVARLIDERPELHGVWHVAGERISKYDLLRVLNDAYGIKTTIEPDARLAIDRTLCGARFREATGIVIPSWETMAARLAAEESCDLA